MEEVKEVREELEVEATEETNEKKGRDWTDIPRELTELVKENYLTGFQLGLSLWEGNLKILSNQIDLWMSAQEGYTKLMRELEKFPPEMASFWSNSLKPVNGQTDKILALQKDYSDAVLNTSDRIMKEALTLTRNGVDRAFSMFNDYLSLLRG